MDAPQIQLHSSIFRNDWKMVTFLKGQCCNKEVAAITYHLPDGHFCSLFSDDGREGMSCFYFFKWLLAGNIWHLFNVKWAKPKRVAQVFKSLKSKHLVRQNLCLSPRNLSLVGVNLHMLFSGHLEIHLTCWKKTLCCICFKDKIVICCS